jgi:hypothetical protein
VQGLGRTLLRLGITVASPHDTVARPIGHTLLLLGSNVVRPHLTVARQ